MHKHKDDLLARVRVLVVGLAHVTESAPDLGIGGESEDLVPAIASGEYLEVSFLSHPRESRLDIVYRAMCAQSYAGGGVESSWIGLEVKRDVQADKILRRLLDEFPDNFVHDDIHRWPMPEAPPVFGSYNC